MFIEAIGLIATVIIVASFTQRGEKNIRTLNCVGALLMAIYGWVIGATSCWLSNAILALIQLRYLFKEETKK